MINRKEIEEQLQYIVYEQYNHRMKGVFNTKEEASDFIYSMNEPLKILFTKKQIDKSMPITW